MHRKTLLITLLIFIFSAVPAFASGYDTEFFGTTVKVSKDNSYDIEEVIRVDFSEPHHGIFRYIPIKGTRISNIAVPGHEHTSYKEGSNEVIKIGSADRVITGEHSYLINYKLSMWADENNTKDMLLVNVLPTDWETPIKEFVCVVEMPEKADFSSAKVYSGPYGSAENENNIKISIDGNSIALKGYDIPTNNGVTLALDLPDGYWNAPLYGGFTGGLYMCLLAPIFALGLWLANKEKVVVTPEFYPPNDMTPGELGYYCDEEANDKDLFASIVYLASKGYLEIKDENGLVFEEVKSPPKTEPDYIRTLYKGIFSNVKQLRKEKKTAKSKNFGATFSRQFNTAKKELKDMFWGDRAIYNENAETAQEILLVASILPSVLISVWALYYGVEHISVAIYSFAGALISLYIAKYGKNINSLKIYQYLVIVVIGIASCLLLSCSFIDSKNWYAVPLWALSTLLTILPAINMNTRQDVRLYGRILGFKDFIETAELDKLNTLIEEDPKYFFNIIPYAYVFGLTDKWINKFESINTKMPEIYTDIKTTKRIMTGYTNDMTRGLSHSRHLASEEDARQQRYISENYRDISSYINEHTHTTSHHDSWTSGGGFSGGGFSGGGSGGGGGGAW